jgi:hypothetical protein
MKLIDRDRVEAAGEQHNADAGRVVYLKPAGECRLGYLFNFALFIHRKVLRG